MPYVIEGTGEPTGWKTLYIRGDREGDAVAVSLTDRKGDAQRFPTPQGATEMATKLQRLHPQINFTVSTL